MADTKPASDAVSFEQALEELDQVVKDLESGDIGLDQSLARYEQGVLLLKKCRVILDEAERKIRLLTGIDAEGNPITEEFDATATAERIAAGNEPAPPKSRTTGRGARRAASEEAAGGELLF